MVMPRRRTRILLLALLIMLTLAGALYVRSTREEVPVERILSCGGTPVTDAVAYREADAPAAASLVELVSLESPTGATVLDDGTLLVTSRPGELIRVEPDGSVESVLDLTAEVSTQVEQGLLSVAATDTDLWLTFTDLDGALRLVGYDHEGGVPDPDTRTDLFSQAQPTQEHIGGHLQLGRDRMLYLGVGDGGNDYEQAKLADDRDALFGKILRFDPATIDPETGGLAVPADNPHVGDDGARPEVWLSGLRNPWSFSFDPDGDLWIGDVGANCQEEIDRIPAGTSGLDLGWPRFEGNNQAVADEDDGATTYPILTYSHGPRCAVVAGYVYRGTAIDGLEGAFVYGDLCEPGVLRWLREVPDGGYEGGVLLGDDEFASVVGFAESPDGELYVIDLTGGIYQIVAAP